MSAQAEQSVSPAGRATVFPTTRWSLVLQAGAAGDHDHLSPLESLCRQYWYPVYSFLRRQGHTHHDSEDLTQGFFAHLLTAEGIASATPDRGHFRTFLLCSLRHFTTNVWRHDHALRRGGAFPPQPLELVNAEGRFTAEPVDPGITPEDAFDRSWALDLIEQATADLKIEYEKSGHGDLFTELLPFAFGRDATEPQAPAAHRVGLNEHAFTVALGRLRRRLREQLRTRVANTVANPQEVDDEIQILLATLRHQSPPR